jgi:hypothetical protein
MMHLSPCLDLHQVRSQAREVRGEPLEATA